MAPDVSFPAPRTEGRNQISARPRNFARHDRLRCTHHNPNNPLDPNNFRPQKIKYTGVWNASNGLHGEKVRGAGAQRERAATSLRSASALTDWGRNTRH
jgi:hypothetical protein